MSIKEAGPHPFRWTVSNLSFRSLIFIQRIPQRSLPPQAAEVQWLTFFRSFAWQRPSVELQEPRSPLAPGVCIPGFSMFEQ